MKIGGIWVVIFLMGQLALGEGRSRQAIPLLPPSADELAAREYNSQLRAVGTKSSGAGVAITLGTLGFSSNTSTEIAGLRLNYGGRVALPISVSHRFRLKPALGYFRRSEGIGRVAVVHNLLEGMVGGSYLFHPYRGWTLGVGGNTHFDLQLTQLQVISHSTGIPPTTRIRVGPAVEASYRISSDMSFTSELEMGGAFSDANAFYSSVLAGLIFHL